MPDDSLVDVLYTAVDAVGRALAGVDDWGPSGLRPGQYQLDLVADAAALEVLHSAGLAVLSEESGLTAPDGSAGVVDLLAVLDPVDGSTNAAQRLPWYATSICVLDADGPLASVVVNQATGTNYDAERGAGARKDGRRLRASSRTSLSEAVVGITGFPRRLAGWAQFRAFGAASLDLCAVAEGSLDAFVSAGGSGLYSWDYLGAMLVCTEAGVCFAEADDLALVIRTPDRRQPIAAGTAELLEEVRRAGM